MFTADEEVADDVTHLFNYLTGYSAKADYKQLLVAPVNLRSRMRSHDRARDRAPDSTGRKGASHLQDECAGGSRNDPRCSIGRRRPA